MDRGCRAVVVRVIGVDVLAVLDSVLEGQQTHSEIIEARAAVADLIEAADDLPTLQGAQHITLDGWGYVLVAPEDLEFLRAALARCLPAEIPGMTKAEEAAEVHKR